MITSLHGPLRRQITIDGVLHVLTISPLGLKLTEKGHRKGIELAWKDLATGDAALAVALNASVRAAPRPRERAGGRGPPPRRRGPRPARRVPSRRRG
jgi:hypothetical protein